MKGSIVLITLFFGVLVCASKTEAAVASVSIFKGMETLQNNPWYPMEGENPVEGNTSKEPPSDQVEE